MAAGLQHASDTHLHKQREKLRRELLRVTTAVGVVLVVVLALAVVAVMAGTRSARNLHRAEQAEKQAEARLWNAYLEQARAVRLSGQAGRRRTVMNVISNAASIKPSVELRNEAIASLVLDELEPERPLIPLPPDAYGLDFDSELKRYASGNSHGLVRIYDTDTQRELLKLSATNLGPATRMSIRNVSFSPDGRLLGARFAGGAVVIWDIDSQQVRVTAGLEATNIVLGGVNFGPDSRQALFSDPDHAGEISRFDIASGVLLGHSVAVGARHFKFKPGTNIVAVAFDNELRLYDHTTGEIIRSLPHDSRTVISAFSPDGRYLAVSCQRGDVYLWDLQRDLNYILRGHGQACLRLGFSADGALLVSGSRDGTSRVWDVSEQSPVAMTDEGLLTEFAQHGRRMGFVKPNAGLATWRLVSGDDFRSVLCGGEWGELMSVDLSPSGRWCVATMNHGFRLWCFDQPDAETSIAIPDLISVRVSADDAALLVCRARGLERWPLPRNVEAGGKLELAEPLKLQLPGAPNPRFLALDQPGRTAAMELADLRMAVVDLQGERPMVMLKGRSTGRYFRSPGSLTGSGRFAISPDGKWVAVGFGFGTGNKPEVWNAETGESVAQLDASSAVVAFSYDGKSLGVATTTDYSVWSVGDWKRIKRYARAEASTTHGAMAFSGDSSEIATCPSRRYMQLLNPEGGTQIAEFNPPVFQSINALRMAADGSVLVAATASDFLQIWRLNSLRQKLAPLGLDWMGTQAGASVRAPSSTVLPFTLVVSVIGIGLAVGFVFFMLGRHRTLIDEFLAADNLAQQRSRELESATLELFHSQKMKALGTLAAGIAHDFNNLLSVIRMSNKLIGREVPSSPEVREHVETVEQAVQQGKHLVESMLGYSRDRADDDKPKDVEGIIEETVGLLSKEFLSGITLQLELERSLPPVSVPAGKIEQMLLNLIVNASEAMKGQGKLKLSAHRRVMTAAGQVLAPRDGYEVIEIAVSDSGPGIAREVLQRMFEPFFSTKNAGNRRGTGLGLSMVYNIAEQEGFGLGVESMPGQGAVFRIGIPLKDSPPVRHSHTGKPAASA